MKKMKKMMMMKSGRKFFDEAALQAYSRVKRFFINALAFCLFFFWWIYPCNTRQPNPPPCIYIYLYLYIFIHSSSLPPPLFSFFNSSLSFPPSPPSIYLIFFVPLPSALPASPNQPILISFYFFRFQRGRSPPPPSHTLYSTECQQFWY